VDKKSIMSAHMAPKFHFPSLTSRLALPVKTSDSDIEYSFGLYLITHLPLPHTICRFFLNSFFVAVMAKSLFINEQALVAPWRLFSF
jgi:hypothetical protein